MISRVVWCFFLFFSVVLAEEPRPPFLTQQPNGPIRAAVPLHRGPDVDGEKLLDTNAVVYKRTPPQLPSDNEHLDTAATSLDIERQQSANTQRREYIEQQLAQNQQPSHEASTGATEPAVVLPLLDDQNFPALQFSDILHPEFGIPNITLPGVQLPEINLSVPALQLPELNFPHINVSGITLPDVPQIRLPVLSVPNINLSKISMQLPNVSVDLSRLPNIPLPSVKLPAIPDMPSLPKISVPELPVQLPPLESLTPTKLLQEYPFRVPHLEVPNAVEGAKVAAENVGKTMTMLPEALLGGSKAVADTAAKIGRQAMVAGSSVALMSLLGLQPTQNTGMGEYRRVTQTPEVRFELHKVESPPPALGEVSLTSWSSKDAQQQQLNDAKRTVQDLLQEERDLQKRFAALHRSNALLLGAVTDQKAQGSIGVGTREKEVAQSLKEQVTTAHRDDYALQLGTQLSPVISNQYYTPIKDRADNREILTEGTWLPRAGRTYKQTMSLVPKGSLSAERPIQKHSPLELRENAKLTGPLLKELHLQLTPQRSERLD